MEKIKPILTILLMIIATCACSTQPVQTEPAATPTQAIEATAGLPLTEAEVPRVSVDDARAALERGEAVIVDVRSDAAYEVSHIAGAINIQLGEIETNPTGLNLDQDQWIITYCT